MPWRETSSVEQREQFIADERRGLYTRTELCAPHRNRAPQDGHRLGLRIMP
jgi:hypothetical protein